MRVLVIGGGGREHALIRAIRKNPTVTEILAMPGNGGIAQDAVCVPVKATDLDAVCAFVKENPVDFAVVAPDDPLALGLVDRLHAMGVACFGPEAKAARIESSKAFAKNLMKRYGIPTAEFRVFSNEAEAVAHLDSVHYPVVIKADGLALGKGVIIAADRTEAQSAVHGMMSEGMFGKSGETLVIEEFLTGPEVSVLAFTDGHTIKPMISSMDHKRAHDGDTGLNTGGMGTIAPNPYYTPEIAEQCMREIFLPTVSAMRAEGCPFKGCLYFGLMLTPSGPKVIEYNCRFGDPETQVVLPLLKSDLLTIMMAVEEERLSEVPVEWEDGAACCVMIASAGYPQAYEKGKKIDLGRACSRESVTVYHSGTALRDGNLVTAGGRVLGVTAVGSSLAQAVSRAYEAADDISFEGAFFRRDIGQRALNASKE